MSVNDGELVQMSQWICYCFLQLKPNCTVYVYMHKITVKPWKICLVSISVVNWLPYAAEKMKKIWQEYTCGFSAQIMGPGTGPPPMEARPGRDLLPWEQALERDLLPREQDLEGEPSTGADPWTGPRKGSPLMRAGRQSIAETLGLWLCSYQPRL